jgi:uncharacterized membrane protein YkvI
MARGVEAGKIYPAAVTTGIALVLALWAAYALAGAGATFGGIARLPYLKFALISITAIYLLRGLAIIPLFVFAPQQVTPFLIWSSVICIGYGAVHLVGVSQVWDRL